MEMAADKQDDLTKLLVKACLDNDVEFLNQYLKSGVYVTRKALNGRTLVGMAAEKGNCKVIELLLNQKKAKTHSAEPPSALNENTTPEGMNNLEWDSEMFEEVRKSDCGNDPASKMYNWYADILEKTGPLLQELPENFDEEDIDGRQALHYAAKEGHLEAVDLLLKSGSFVNAMDKLNYTALALAVENNRPCVVSRLLEHGAQHGCLQTGGSSVLHICAVRGFLECAKLLIVAGAEVNAANNLNFTPLHCAVEHERVQLVQLLIESGAAVTALTALEDSPLSLAFKTGNVEISKILVQSGAKFGNIYKLYFALQISIKSNNMKLLELALYAKGCMSLNNGMPTVPLGGALQKRNYEAAELILRHGAELLPYVPYVVTDFFMTSRGRDCNELDRFMDLFEAHGWDSHNYIQSNQDAGWLGLHKHTLFLILRRCYDPDFPSIELFRCAHPKSFSAPMTELFARSQALKIRNIVDDRFYFNPLSLQDYTRIAIRKHLRRKLFSKIDTLPLPSIMKSFLKFQDIFCGC